MEWQAAEGRLLPEADAAAELVEKAAGQSPRSSRRRNLGQGYATDQGAKVAVETHAMNAATAYFSDGWHVEDVHGNESFDLRCTRAGAELHVEVKGTTSDGRFVLLTPHEVEHARSFPDVALFVLPDIAVVRDTKGVAIGATGGRVVVYQPWDIAQGSLRPVGYNYAVPILSEDDGRR